MTTRATTAATAATVIALSLSKARKIEYSIEDFPMLETLLPDDVASFLEDLEVYELQLEPVGLKEATLVRSLSRSVLRQI